MTIDHVAHAVRMSEIAAQVAREHFRGTLGVEFKTDESPVTQADKSVEAEVRAYLAEHFPEHGIFGEEHGIQLGDRRHLWVIDPIDGTRSFLSGHPLFGFLLAYCVDGVPEIGVIGMPAMDETYVGVRGQGAMLNGEPIKSSVQAELDQSILYVNEGERIYRDNPTIFSRLLDAGQTRRFSYDCYPHALLAAGHVDAVVDYGLQPYDFLPVAAVTEAAGGIMTDWGGAALDMNSDGRVISAATPDLHAQLLALIQD